MCCMLLSIICKLFFLLYFSIMFKKNKDLSIVFWVYLFSLLKCTHTQPYLASIKQPSMTYLTFSGGGYVIAGNPHPQTYTLIFRLGCIFFLFLKKDTLITVCFNLRFYFKIQCNCITINGIVTIYRELTSFKNFVFEIFHLKMNISIGFRDTGLFDSCPSFLRSKFLCNLIVFCLFISFCWFLLCILCYESNFFLSSPPLNAALLLELGVDCSSLQTFCC